ncbi:hypothetical protein D9756_003591 [Leucocoprinus leucothites]|uniref:Aminotransferase class I/classII large domain-containing protein n=1 Tax=Leucocoprinus leucothites TaxID=201217 RepID=A0A8H5LJH6_9AGAR|nr:hypothetical protein D9756_003591 [Leucoagaricus leucothites]
MVNQCSLSRPFMHVATDAEGISASSLRSRLENWPAGKPRPKVLYTVPYGCNPTGMTATLERRVEVLKLAREFDFIILEDDPYFYLYYGTAPRVPSYFSLEKELLPETGRVLRFDSFSKVLSAGMRLGFASGPEPILSAIEKFYLPLSSHLLFGPRTSLVYASQTSRLAVLWRQLGETLLL